jgi:hypothetical protein
MSIGNAGPRDGRNALHCAYQGSGLCTVPCLTSIAGSRGDIGFTDSATIRSRVVPPVFPVWPSQHIKNLESDSDVSQHDEIVSTCIVEFTQIMIKADEYGSNPDENHSNHESLKMTRIKDIDERDSIHDESESNDSGTVARFQGPPPARSTKIDLILT